MFARAYALELTSLNSTNRASKYGEQKQARISKNNLSVLSPSTQGIKFLAKHLRSSTEAWIGQAPTNNSVTC
ncbi:transcriptional regulator [Klebsiella quasipneumoniae]|nr:transcriptional regulator [Klebsiella quasipneumoniae subsp. quasipneumoniae]MCU7510236.1 transcriptional regulator [Klebsiella quasipneumoniae]OVX14475.1 transcriptional regulator [Klebsiella quasipneumoniae subsp. similipneumoniae]OSZ18077.1 transcriptional regulator [Klebsiella quasipneumoniae]OVU98667.1 transcriptional regulator [Klebsiella quasipneumoniae subsp. quasipneumoniae]